MCDWCAGMDGKPGRGVREEKLSVDLLFALYLAIKYAELLRPSLYNQQCALKTTKFPTHKTYDRVKLLPSWTTIRDGLAQRVVSVSAKISSNQGRRGECTSARRRRTSPVLTAYSEAHRLAGRHF